MGAGPNINVNNQAHPAALENPLRDGVVVSRGAGGADIHDTTTVQGEQVANQCWPAPRTNSFPDGVSPARQK
jgi:hypothetical protein